MPKGSKGESCRADMIGNAVKVMRIATGEAAGAGGEAERRFCGYWQRAAQLA